MRQIHCIRLTNLSFSIQLLSLRFRYSLRKCFSCAEELKWCLVVYGRPNAETGRGKDRTEGDKRRDDCAARKEIKWTNLRDKVLNVESSGRKSREKEARFWWGFAVMAVGLECSTFSLVNFWKFVFCFLFFWCPNLTLCQTFVSRNLDFWWFQINWLYYL